MADESWVAACHAGRQLGEAPSLSASYGENGSHVSGYGTSYSYDIMGNVLYLSREGGPSSVTEYRGNLVYEDGSLKYVLVDGGMVSMEGSAPRYLYFLDDHLGSTRVVAAEDGTVAQVNHYYPFGMSYASRTMSSDLVPRPGSGVIDSPVIDGGQEKGDVIGSMEAASFTTDQPYRFIGNELYADNGLGLYDFKARLYDPATGRFLSVDPLAEKYYSVSPYAYCAGNPVMYVDPDGMANWRVVMKGIKMAAVGAGGIAGYGAVSSTGIGAFFGAVGLVDSISSFGLGVTYAITGLLMDADDDKGILDAPESMSEAISISVSKIVGSDNKKIEGYTNIILGIMSAPEGFSFRSIEGVISFVLSSNQIIDGFIQVNPCVSGKSSGRLL